MSRIPLLLAFLFVVPFVSAELTGLLGLGDRQEYTTLSHNLSLAFVRYDPETQHAMFLLNDELVDLLPLQRKNISGLGLTYLGNKDASYHDLLVSFRIDGFVPLVCKEECTENWAVSLVRKFDSEFRVCKDNCDAGCELYTASSCASDQLIRKNSCAVEVAATPSCSGFCGSCADCGTAACGASFCSFCPPTWFCASNKECGENELCVGGVCSAALYREGDEVCARSEPCTSPDCSCGKRNITSVRDDYPLILIHGFASSPAKLKRLQRELAFDLGYANGGTLDSSTQECSSLTNHTVYVATYYQAEQRVKGAERLALILRRFLPEQSSVTVKPERTFVNYLGQVVARAKACAGTDKVNIVAHSMGGAVAMEYLMEDDHSRVIHKFILLGSPLKGGIYGDQSYQLFKGIKAQLGSRQDLLKDCSVVGVPSLMLTLIDGRDIIGDCQELQRAGTVAAFGSDETPGIVEYYTISGKVDGRGDGIVSTNSSILAGAVRNSVVPCGHLDLKDPVRCDAAYLEIVKDLGYSEDDLKKKVFSDRVRETLQSTWDGVLILFE
ncbi:MAG: hypothetical protein Q7S65_00605 [Nanoarchaeota archaeon]|nr:hypothetical protein [Nanoarchaeota archaeon]